MPRWVDYEVSVELTVRVRCREDGTETMFGVVGTAPASSNYGSQIPGAVGVAIGQAANRAAPLAKAVLQNETERLR